MQINDIKWKIKYLGLTSFMLFSQMCTDPLLTSNLDYKSLHLHIFGVLWVRLHLNNFKRLLGAKEMENYMFIQRLDYINCYYWALLSCYQSPLCDHFYYINFLLLLFFNLWVLSVHYSAVHDIKNSSLFFRVLQCK